MPRGYHELYGTGNSGKHFPDFLRTIAHENFSVATLLFMIMLPGKPPYAHQGGEGLGQNIVNMNFSYPLGNMTVLTDPLLLDHMVLEDAPTGKILCESTRITLPME